jgi:hypothetical protein
MRSSTNSISALVGDEVSAFLPSRLTFGENTPVTSWLCEIWENRACAKVKVNFTLEQAMKAQWGEEVQLYSFFCLGARWGGGGGWGHSPVAFTPGKGTRYPLYRRLSGPQGLSGRVRKFSPPPEFDPRAVQSVPSRYTDWAIPAHLLLPQGMEPRFLGRSNHTDYVKPSMRFVCFF